MQEDGLSVLAAGPLARRGRHAQEQLQKMAAIVGATIIVAALALFFYETRSKVPTEPIAQSFVAAQVPVAMRKSPSSDSPPVKSLQPSEKIGITECAYDSAGNHWFRVSSEGISGFVRIEDVAPPQAMKNNPEGGFIALRHSLLRIEDPDMLDYARQAVEYYRSVFPGNPHSDELVWLLAEQTHQLAERADGQRNLLAAAREQYQKLAESGGEFAGRARQALDQFPSASSSAGIPRSRTSKPLQFTVVGGSTPPSQTTPGAPEGGPVRRVTVLSRTPLLVSLSTPLDLSPGAQGEGEIAEDIQVKSDLAIPRGSRAHLSVSASRSSPGSGRRDPSLILRLTSLVIGDQTYAVSAQAVQDPSARTLPAGARIEFRLATPLVLAER